MDQLGLFMQPPRHAPSESPAPERDYDDDDTLRRIARAETVGVEAWAMTYREASVRRLYVAGKVRCVDKRNGKTVDLRLDRGFVLRPK